MLQYFCDEYREYRITVWWIFFLGFVFSSVGIWRSFLQITQKNKQFRYWMLNESGLASVLWNHYNKTIIQGECFSCYLCEQKIIHSQWIITFNNIFLKVIGSFSNEYTDTSMVLRIESCLQLLPVYCFNLWLFICWWKTESMTTSVTSQGCHGGLFTINPLTVRGCWEILHVPDREAK